jgi:hypothetical protein
MINISSISDENVWSWEDIYPLNDRRRREITDRYLALSPTMRSVAGQVAIQNYLNEHEYFSMAQFIESINYDPNNSIHRKWPNFWYKLLKGRAMTQITNIEMFFDSVNYPTADILRHPVWHLIDHRISITSSLKLFAEQKGSTLFKREIYWRTLNEIPLSALKQSYAGQRTKLFDKHSLDSFTALLFISLMQIQECHHKRPTTAEQHAYALFLFLFGWKYQVLKKHRMGMMIFELLTPAPNRKNQIVQRLVDDFERVSLIAQSFSLDCEMTKQKAICSKTLEWLTSTRHPCFH